jgi:hypothetical protein
VLGWSVAIDALAEPVDRGWAPVAAGTVAGGDVADARVAQGGVAEDGVDAGGRAVVEQLATAMTTATARPAPNDRLTETGRGGTA